MYEFEEGRSICFQYNFTEAPDPADPHGMDYGLFEPISSILALKTLQDYGLQPSPALAASVASGVSSISNLTFQLRETQYPRRQPRGSGNTLRYNRWQRFYRRPDRVPIGCDSHRLDTDEINDFTEPYVDYLRPNEDLQTVTIRNTNGLQLVSSSNTTTEVRYRLRGLTASVDNGVEQVRITVLTSTGRVEERIISFEVMPVTLEPERFSNPTSQG